MFSNRNGGREKGSRRGWRTWAVLLGAALLFVVFFDLLERLTATESTPPAQSLPAGESVDLPRVTRLGQQGIRIDFWGGGTVIRIEGVEGDRDAVIACIEDGMAELFADTTSPTGFFARRDHDRWMVQEVRRINNECSASPLLPQLPPVAAEPERD
jgi:hypothetical protein